MEPASFFSQENIFDISGEITSQDYRRFSSFLKNIKKGDDHILINIYDCPGGDIKTIQKILKKIFKLQRSGYVFATHAEGFVASAGMYLYLVSHIEWRYYQSGTWFMFHEIQNKNKRKRKKNKRADESYFLFVSKQTRISSIDQIKKLVNKKIKNGEAFSLGIVSKKVL